MMKVTVIVPVYNGEKVITSCLKALLNQNYPRNKYEIIVVDDGSTDHTIKVVKKFKKVKLIQQKHKGPAAARNAGARKAKGDILLFTDSDCIPSKNWIKRMVEPFENEEIVGVSGTYKTLNKEKWVARFVGYEIEQIHERMKKKKFIDFVGTFSAAYRREIFLRLGGFDTRFKTSSGEDPELSFRIAKAGYKMVFQPKAFVYHPHPDSLWKYLKQKYQRAIWRNLMYEKHKEKIVSDSYTQPTLLPQLLIFSLLPLFCAFFLYNPGSILFSVLFLLIVCFLLNLDVILFLFKREKRLAVISPFIFFLRNIAILLGVFVGFVMLSLKKL